MDIILIPTKRLGSISKVIDKVEKRLNCKIDIIDNSRLSIEGEAYDEYNAKNVLEAIIKGFSLNQAYKLLNQDYFFKYVDLKDLIKKDTEIKRVKSRIIGKEGKTKGYIEEVSGVSISLQDNILSMIGTVEELKIATAALQIIVEGGTHKKAYRIMESLRKKYR
ncbi:MAG: KH domain-containing protein [Candidatus Micrarchaeia archaeon]